MNKKLKRVLAVVLAAAMTTSMAACGKKQGAQNPEEQQAGTDTASGFVWVPEFVDLGQDINLYGAVFHGDYLYYTKYEYDEETGNSGTRLLSVSVADGTPGLDLRLGGDGDKDDADAKDADAKDTDAKEVDKKDGNEKAKDSNLPKESRSLSSFFIDKDGNIITVENIYRWSEDSTDSSREFFIGKYNAAGEKISEQDINEVLAKDENNVWIQRAAMDGQGRLYLCCDLVIHLLDAEGKYDGSIKMDQDAYIQNVGTGRDGKMYVSFYERNSNGQILKEIDYEGRKLGQSYDNFPDGYSNGTLALGLEKDFLVSEGNTLYEYDLATQTTEKLLDWLDCGINGDSVNGLHTMEDGRILATIQNWEENIAELALLTKKPAAEVPQKTQLVLATLSEDYDLSRVIVKFNRGSDKYHISMKKYFDYNDVVWSGDSSNWQEVLNDAITRMNNDITSSSNCPDMISTSDINVKRYASKGIFEDLGAYIDNTAGMSREDYFENLLESYTVDGKLVAIPKNFQLETLVGKTSQVGEKPGWTLAEMLAYGDKYPDAMLFGYATKSSALSRMLFYSQGDFVDWESGKCSFDNENFIRILEFADRFPKEWQYGEDEPSLPKQIADGEILLEGQSFYDFQGIQVEEAIFGEPVTYIGYPNDKGESGTYIQPGAGVAVTTSCKDKEGAWAFIQAMLDSEGEVNGRYRGFRFPSSKKAFAALRAEATKIEYVKDENGENVLDENGEPIIMNSGGSMGWGDDWTYEYHIPTAEEADKLEELIKIARPASSSDQMIMNIIDEEAQSFFEGQKSAKDVAGVIQSRVQVYVNENM